MTITGLINGPHSPAGHHGHTKLISHAQCPENAALAQLSANSSAGTSALLQELSHDPAWMYLTPGATILQAGLA